MLIVDIIVDKTVQFIGMCFISGIVYLEYYQHYEWF